jgi:8-oxo-dGTP diphosphatase
MRYCWRCGAALSAPPPVTCAACGQEHFLNPLPCGEAVLLRGSQVLLLRRAVAPYRDAWDIPGGFCDGDEHPMHAAEREMAEELGVTGRATGYIGTWIDTYGDPAPDGVQVHTAVSSYLVALDDPGAEFRLDLAENAEARWFELRHLPDDLAFPVHTVPMLAAVAAIVDGTGRPLPDRVW